ncbi:methionyl-tRNA formyltransferase [Pseudothauera nasutitermitis]|uniref:Methionyl-tRNA formyltransferase n=1 Tax=Pseudothauera nasutitermitis TaxID=2565930 RepID=A0A4S4AV65_9RHOO|nr:formyltransferase family protein [Pseudothauera nasutitermitis]THF63121.1 methionyl-tRNA formyltransferase [Pseudothauera nasutitermitis]
MDQVLNVSGEYCLENNSITVLVDNDSWIIPYAHHLVQALKKKGFDAEFVDSADKVYPGWVNFILGCTRIIRSEVLQRNQHNLVVHESDLPKGRGFAPMAWQILEGKRSIPICLIEATDEVDAGDIWLSDVIELDGTELCDEWRSLQGQKTVELCLKFVSAYPTLKPVKQQGGEPSYYSRRIPADSRLDVDKSLREQFNLFRIVDNERYPAYFEMEGRVYTVQLFKVESKSGD